MASIFDQQEFSGSLFYPTWKASEPPTGSHDVGIEVEAGVDLHARLYEHPASCVRIVFFHGNGETIAGYDHAASYFTTRGADLAVVDYRGYGRSDGEPTLRSCLADAHVVVAHVARQPSATGRALPLIVMGRSLGSMCATELCRESAESVKGIILESGIADLVSFVGRRGFPVGALSSQDVADFDPLPKLRASALPLLVLHGADDTVIPAAKARMAYEASSAHDRRLVIVPARGHNDLAFAPVYWQELGDFIQRVMG